MFEVASNQGIQKLTTLDTYEGVYICSEGVNRGMLYMTTEDTTPGIMEPSEFVDPLVVDAFENAGIEIHNYIIYFLPVRREGNTIVINHTDEALWLYELSVNGNLLGEGPDMGKLWTETMRKHYPLEVAYDNAGREYADVTWATVRGWDAYGVELESQEEGRLDWNEIDWNRTIQANF